MLKLIQKAENTVLSLFSNKCTQRDASSYRNSNFIVQKREWCWWIISELWLQDTEVNCSTINSRRGPYHTNRHMNHHNDAIHLRLKMVLNTPVFNLPIVNPAASKVLARPTEGASPRRPASCVSNPGQFTCTIQMESISDTLLTLAYCTNQCISFLSRKFLLSEQLTFR